MKGGYKRTLTQAEIAWTMEAIEKLGKDHIKMGDIKKAGLIEEYGNKFGVSLTLTGLYTRLLRFAFPDRYKAQQAAAKAKRMLGGGKTPANENAVFNDSRYIIYVKGQGLVGLDTVDEVKEFLSKNSAIADKVKCFKNIPLSVEVKVTVGEQERA